MSTEMIAGFAVAVGVCLGMGLLAGFRELLQWDNQRRLAGERARLQDQRAQAIDQMIAKDRAQQLRRRPPAAATGPAPRWDGNGQRHAPAPWDDPRAGNYLAAAPPWDPPYTGRPVPAAGKY